MEIKLANVQDIDVWMDLVEQVRNVFPGLETARAMEEHRDTVLRFMKDASAICAVDAERMVGILLFSKGSGELCFLAVHPAYRRQHIAQKLVSFMMTQIEDGKDISLITYQEGDPNGIAPRAFYKHLGFSEGRLTEGFGHPAQEFILKRSAIEQI